MSILTDVHEIEQVKAVKQLADVLQIPAFLCLQTKFVIANATFSSASISGSTLTLNLTGVVNTTYVTIELLGLSDTAGQALSGDSDVTVGALYGDVNGTGNVSVGDQQAVKNRLFQPLSVDNFLFDLNLSGTITVGDQQAVKNGLFTLLPV